MALSWGGLRATRTFLEEGGRPRATSAGGRFPTCPRTTSTYRSTPSGPLGRITSLACEIGFSGGCVGWTSTSRNSDERREKREENRKEGRKEG